MKSAIFLAAAAATTVLAFDSPVAGYKYLDGVGRRPAGAIRTVTAFSEVPAPSVFQETVTVSKIDIFYTTLTTTVDAATLTPGPGHTGHGFNNNGHTGHGFDNNDHDGGDNNNDHDGGDNNNDHDGGDHDDNHDNDDGDEKDDDKHDFKGGDDEHDDGSKKKGGNKALGGAAPFITNDPFVAASAAPSAFGSASASASASLKPISSLGGAPKAGATRAPAGNPSTSNKVNKQAASSATVVRVSGYLMAGAAACAWFLL